ncbi:MAG: hypothetical protein Tsb009_36400 [Planctomycetaceae bacterium]
MVREADPMTNAASNPTPSPPAKSAWKRRLIFWPLYSLYLFVLCWMGLKAYWYFTFDVPITRSVEPDDVWRNYYPELWHTRVIQDHQTADDGDFDVLLLGGSVLEQTAPELERELKRFYGEKLRLYNVSKSAHTTRDSYHKWKRLGEKQFDLVVIYHGINDIRMNCCPDGEFRDDYTHCAWYASFERRIQAKSLMIQGVGLDRSASKIGLGAPDEPLLDAGNTIKTTKAFRSNLNAIIQAANVKHTPVLLMTFASYLPENYSRAAFEAGELDYGKGQHQLAAELWGHPRNVRKTLAAHNAVIRQLARENPQVVFIDQAKQMSQTGRHFSDPCHLTEKGIEAFVANMMPVIKQHFENSK